MSREKYGGKGLVEIEKLTFIIYRFKFINYAVTLKTRPSLSYY